jgi:acyl-CoA thioesterase
VTTAFDRASATRSVRAGVHAVDLDPGWAIADKPHGGYLLAAMARAAVASVAEVEGPPHPHPVAASAHYLASPVPGPAEVHVDVLRRGRRMSQARARLVQESRPCVEAVLTLGRHEDGAEPWWADASPPVIPPPDECVRLPGVSHTGIRLSIMDNVEVRLDPAVMGFASGRPGGSGELRGWLAFADGREPDPLSLLHALDGFPPATFELVASGWVPTLELTAYVRAVPAPGPLLVRQRAGMIEADLVDEVCHVWDSRGRLVAQGTQLAGIRVGDATAP